ncbi:hypothetical protein [Flavobacterium aciduliphilum]|uniref:Protein phosphatase 2C-like protein n=1 Tax=Flavobacterium aciduliphilum TaxID=1101402 RepID=A0A328YKL4_9FLAO|nr:hypothetical protein [Flavobacterium aciduliphilum]RAR73854.1 hypothetical protein CLV55_103173 [Flavobacterium aciduliphilum]
MQQNKDYFSIYNFIDKVSEEENEDAVLYKESKEGFKLAVSDGAGGAGIYCKTWADFLVNCQPEIPFENESIIQDWFLQNSKKFYKTNIDLINNSDPFIIEKFIKDGSYATLLYVWWNSKTKLLSYTGIGDTTMFIFRKKNNDYIPILITPIDKQKTLDDFPKLLNWNKKLNYDLSRSEIELKSDDILIISTDSIARWIIYHLIILAPDHMLVLLNENIIKNKDINKTENFNLNNKYKSISDLIQKIEVTMNTDLLNIKCMLEKQINLELLEKDDFTMFFKRF